MHLTVLPLLFLLLAAAPLAFSMSTCSVYKNKTDNCAASCGSCFNPGGRGGHICQGPSTGYYCSTDPNPGQDMAYACMDWTFGSTAMIAAETAFNKREGDDVYFGVGTYGTSDDPQRGLGACYRLEVDTVDKSILVQSINTGSDVAGNQFDLQIGDGGTGAFNTCAGSPDSSMYPGPISAWGHQYGGVDNRADCAGLPKYPAVPGPMKAAGDDLVALCEYGFDKKVRGEGGSNPSLLNVTRVRCPPELVHMTQMQRTDGPDSPTAAAAAAQQQLPEPAFRRNSTVAGAPKKCQADVPGGGTAYCLTRMMDCRKPSGGFKDNVKGEIMAAGMKIVQPCMRDGYTRIDVQCGCLDCYC